MKKIILFLICAIVYPTTFANYQINVDDSLKIYKIDKKIGQIIEKSRTPELLKEKLIDKISKLLWKSKNEINSIGYLWNYELDSYREYALIKIYRYLSYWDVLISKDQSAQILENDFIKVISTSDNISIDNDYVYLTYTNGNKWKMIEFFIVSPDDDTVDYINNHFIEEEYIWKCKTTTKPEKSRHFTKNKIYSILAFWDYLSDEILYNNKPCWTYWAGRSISYFDRLSDRVLIYINAGQDFNGLDFWSIELK